MPTEATTTIQDIVQAELIECAPATQDEAPVPPAPATQDEA